MFSKSRLQVETPDQSFNVELADTFLSKFFGFRFRSEGKMMFYFSDDVRAQIDMLFVSNPLYLYFIDSDKTVIEVQKAEPWRWNPATWKFYRPDRPYRYLLESFEQLELVEGEKIEFEV